MPLLMLDTSVIVDHLNGRRRRTEYLERLVDQGHRLACCAVNVTEVYAGLRPGEEEPTRVFLQSLAYLPLTREVAARAGTLRRDWRQRGQMLSLGDVTIAAVALAFRAPLVTDNRRHFPMSELELWPLPQ